MKICRIEQCESTDMASRSAMCKIHHRLYLKQHYADNKQYYIDKAARHKAKIMKIVWDLKSQPCTDCGHTYPPFVMDFDHLDPCIKIDNLAVLVNKGSVDLVLQEIAKCELVCSNCHRIRTYNRRK